jgi:hypothetical protein
VAGIILRDSVVVAGFDDQTDQRIGIDKLLRHPLRQLRRENDVYSEEFDLRGLRGTLQDKVVTSIMPPS